MLINNNLLTKKTQYFTIFLAKIVKKFIYGLKINHNQINIYISPTKILYLLTFLKGNSISNFDKLVDIVVVDNISNINRFEITYFF